MYRIKNVRDSTAPRSPRTAKGQTVGRELCPTEHSDEGPHDVGEKSLKRAAGHRIGEVSGRYSNFGLRIFGITGLAPLPG